MAYNSKLSTPQIEQALGAALLQEKGQYNITQDKGANYATLSEAIAAVSDDKYKVKGIVLTYNTGTEWVSKRYNGEDAGGFADEGNWTSVSLEADDEDIEQVNGLAKFKDRKYDEANFSGKGYKILRKNIQEVSVPKFDLTITNGCTSDGNITVTVGYEPVEIPVTTAAATAENVAALIGAAVPDVTVEGAVVTLKSNPTVDYSTTGVTGEVADNTYTENRNVLTQEMMNEANTVYEIRYDFDLNGAEITVPEGCVLKFEGGSLRNGVIVCNDIFFSNLKINTLLSIKFVGSILNVSVYPDTFGIVSHQSKEDIVNNQKEFDCLSSFVRCQYNSVIIFDGGYYGFGGEGEVYDGFVGNKSYSSYRRNALYLSGDKLKNITINGNGSHFINMVKCHYGAWKRTGNIYTKVDDDGTFKYNTDGGGFLCIRLDNEASKLEVNNVNSDYSKDRFYGGNVEASSSQSAIRVISKFDYVVIKNSSFVNNMTDGISLSNNGNVLIENCFIDSSGRTGISLDTSDKIIINNCIINNSGDIDFSLVENYRFEGPGCSINSEPTKGHTKNISITNCSFLGCAYAFMSFGHTDNNYNENIGIRNIKAKALKTGYSINGNSLEILEGFPSIVNGYVVKDFLMKNCELINTQLQCERIYINNRLEDSFDDEINVNVSNIYIYTSHDIEILTNDKYLSDRTLYAFNLNTAFESQNDLVTNDNKKYNINLFDIYSYLANNVMFITNNKGDRKLVADNLYAYIIETRSSGVCNNSNVFKEDYITNINNLYIINKSTLEKTVTDYFFYKAAKKVHVINDFDKNSEFVPIVYSGDRTEDIASLRNSKKSISYTESFNFIRLARDNWRESLFGIVQNEEFAKLLPDYSILINDIQSSSYKDVLFSSILGNKYGNFYGERKGLPFSKIDSLSDLGFNPLEGESVYYTNQKKRITYDGKKWLDSLGNPVDALILGTFADKPLSSTGIKEGFQYYCTDKQSPESSEPGLMIYHKGSDVWVDSLGRVVDDNYPATPPATSGTTEERPLGVDPGFQYFDTTLNKPIWKSADGWVDSTGASV